MENEILVHPFDPIVFGDTETLILGAFPSKQSFENAFYYAHPRNQFWPILSRITGYPIVNRDQKIWLLKEMQLGVWDMIARCSRENSLDSSLEDEVVNDIPALLERYPTIERIAFTGRKAEALWQTHYGHLEIETIYLPSPSPAYASMTLEQKATAWREALGIGRALN
jgi:hypoxanthine-DNA glycosylase